MIIIHIFASSVASNDTNLDGLPVFDMAAEVRALLLARFGMFFSYFQRLELIVCRVVTSKSSSFGGLKLQKHHLH
jgi:hypothetical protein